MKTANKRSLSSQKWLERQLNDPYVARAKREGYRSRAAFKLLEIDEKYNLLKPGQRVVDLGAAPGGWSQIAAQGGRREGQVVGIDLLPIDPMPGVEFIELDFLDETAPGQLIEMLGGPADVVMSDMAANTTGHKKTDHLRIMGLAEAAIYFAREILAPGGSLRRQGVSGRHRESASDRPQAGLRRRCATSSRRRAGPIPRNSTCWRPVSGDGRASVRSLDDRCSTSRMRRTTMALHRIGIIGLGKIAQDQHLPVIRANPDFQLARGIEPARAHPRRMPATPSSTTARC